ncbi:hypothetical protein N7468_001874 [Penicillium chermesinum]|uniref:Pre-mRNA-processing protein prp40 n=1 Tax=Penicillium chermesinum TaxID=63820 RepID=A0A9W9TWY9_9EURO|nr:uncharacterized protein N7468_001874 [Penicillium chermesinum]KAJ5246891.1 hypothetical protein N7468_001874 [Penicillium chermesinum]
MDTMNSTPGAPVLWQEARNSDGRVYYYHVQTKQTQWTKPVELMTPAERALSSQPYKEYQTEDGRKYWYNQETKQSTWEMPEVYKNALAQASAPQAPAAQTPQALVPAFTAETATTDAGMGGVDHNALMLASALNTQHEPEPEYHTLKEATTAFEKMLRRHHVQADWTWEQTVRATIQDPQYRAIKDPRDRKAAFEKYANDLRNEEEAQAKERLEKLRADFNTMLQRHPEIKHYSRWKTIRPIIEGETTFRATSDENERRRLFEDYILDLKKSHIEQEAVTRKAAMDELGAILNSLVLEPYTRWSEAQAAIESNDKMQTDTKFKTLTKCDILTAFENHIKSLERSFNDARQEQKAVKARKARRAREKYLELLKELKSQGNIKAGTKWVNIRPMIQDDPRYQAMLGQPGSSPLELFWDMVEEEERALRRPRNEVLDILDDKRFEVTAATTFEEFKAVVDTDRRASDMSPELLALIFERIKEKVVRRNEEEKHAADRHHRHAVEALRSRIKRLEPPVRATDTWEQVQPRLEKYEEYKAVETDELRKSAFEKFIRRLIEKDEDNENDRGNRERDRNRRHDHDRSGREYRGGRGERRRGSMVSHSPETDAYEADRRQAQADRERSYRKTSGFSPSRDRHDDRDRDRYRRPYRDYDRREIERERLYLSRGDPHGSRDELDYGGDTRSVASTDRRRRRDSDGDSVASRSVKRYRRGSREPDHSKASGRERTREHSTIPEEEIKKEKAIHSGSEEGEIEED